MGLGSIINWVIYGYFISAWDFFIYITMEAIKLSCYFIVYVVLEFDY